MAAPGWGRGRPGADRFAAARAQLTHSYMKVVGRAASMITHLLCLWEKSTFSKPSLAQETSASHFSYRRPDIHCRPSKAG